MNVRLYHSMDDDDANWCEAEQNRISRPASRMHNIISLIPEHVRQALTRYRGLADTFTWIASKFWLFT